MRLPDSPFILLFISYYTPGSYAEGCIVFVFPLVRMLCLFVHVSIPFVELLQSFMLKFLNWGISQQPLIRKHSYLDHRYPGGSASIPRLVARGQKTRTPLKSVFYFSVLETTYADSWSDMAQPCDMDLWVM